MAVITMGGLAGGGARTLGPLVAQSLGADYTDRLILANVARQIGATVEALSEREERLPTRGERFSRFLQRVLERSAATGAGGDPYFGPGVAAFLTEEYDDLSRPTITRGHELEDEKYLDAIRSVVRDLAARGNVVIVGRAAHLILRDVPSVLRVGLIASLEDRISTVVERERLDRERAERTVLARDQARAHFFKRFFDIDEPEHPSHYHMVINTSEVNRQYASDMIVQASAALDEGRLSPGVGAVI